MFETGKRETGKRKRTVYNKAKNLTQRRFAAMLRDRCSRWVFTPIRSCLARWEASGSRGHGALEDKGTCPRQVLYFKSLYSFRS